VNGQFLPGGFFDIGFVGEVLLNGFGTFVVVVPGGGTEIERYIFDRPWLEGDHL
jgi:hypothetical protein